MSLVNIVFRSRKSSLTKLRILKNLKKARHFSVGALIHQKNDEHIMHVFDRNTKSLQRERAASAQDANLYDYLKDEIGYRLADRVFDIKRKFKLAADIGCSRGYVSKHISPKCIEELILCDMNRFNLDSVQVQEGIKVRKQVLDEEHIEFEPNSLDLVISSLSLHWVNDLPNAFKQILKSLKEDGVLLAAVFGGDTLYELRSSLQLAELERRGGISPHISPFTEVRDIGNLLTRAGFTMLTIDTDEIVVNYPTLFELMWDLKGMAESNAAINRSLHLHRETQFAAAAIYQQLYGKTDPETGKTTIPATFQIINMLGWKPHPKQPKPLERGSGEVSLKDLYKLDEIIKEVKKIKNDDDQKN
ncbi:arginine-hydroxylase NDUFAF5, mitochondrial [Tribolium castaneum]|uniref:NADH dehydrogenase [ubiquinone] 1 alpha subcomplex assembly factor 5-like Protein n=1 Tax=Tribolium castaneum TaxID=7070 RepID=D6WD45_TRICA|nr:PREDICTED: NADH dehydrogenase [ubiquinone] 1 alpha subcomplex assembly factor 5 [Tribolium castaneum]EEZ98317.1 NADH dehydrogenase [ubiquinone] 1 alpha subcomplex assembly factor 5-like Protein [Tribolium castaneum]|eukprot:XP_971724.1 PREDICTED: NADH dehydrogenase [ubiquinone] 1 alpha subcomplex assembly factor 5 [Tribolium castaneum]